MSDTTISDAALPVVARYVGTTSNIYRYIAEDLAVVDAQIADEAKKPEAVRLRDELRERAEFEAWANSFYTYPLDMSRDVDGHYAAGLTCEKFAIWKAALASRHTVGQVPVAVVGPDFTLLWAGSGPIAPIVERHGLKRGSLLYASPTAQAVDLGQLRALADRWATDRSYSGSPSDDLRALIDGSKAVQS